MEEYKPNSNKAREQHEEKKVRRVATGPVKTRKKSDAQKLADIFVTEDMDSVKSYIFLDILVPAIKRAISDIVTNGIDMILYGETGHTKRNSGGSRVSYNSLYDSDRNSSRTVTRGRTGFDYNQVEFDNRADADAVLAELDDLMAQYHVVSVMDFYVAAGVPTDYTHQKYGWTDIRSAGVIRTRNGYIIKMPKAMPLD